MLSALRLGVPVLKKEARGKDGMVACLNAFEEWLLCGGTGRVEALSKAVSECMSLMYAAELFDKDLCETWWEARCTASSWDGKYRGRYLTHTGGVPQNTNYVFFGILEQTYSVPCCIHTKNVTAAWNLPILSTRILG